MTVKKKFGKSSPGEGVILRKNEPLEVKSVRGNCALMISKNDHGTNK